MGRYLTTFTLTFLLLTGGFVGQNMLADPLNLWRCDGVCGISDLDRMLKPRRVASQNPDVVLIGSSHTEEGFAQQSVREILGAERPFNLAMGGMQIYEVVRYLEHTLGSSSPRHVLVFLDSMNFIDRFKTRTGFSEDRLAVTENGWPNPLHALADFPRIYLSWDSLDLQDNPGATNLDAQGFRPCAIDDPPTSVKRMVQTAGIRYRSHMVKGMFGTGAAGNPDDLVRRLFELTLDDDVQFTLVVPPQHSTYYSALRKAELWDDHLRFIATLVRIKGETGSPARIIDFTGFNPRTTQMHFNPQSGFQLDKTITGWADTDHFTCGYGHNLLKQVSYILHGGHSQFATELGPVNVSAHLNTLETSARSWWDGNAAFYGRLLGWLYQR